MLQRLGDLEREGNMEELNLHFRSLSLEGKQSKQIVITKKKKEQEI